MNTPGKDYTHHSWLAAAALIAVLVAVSFIPPQSVGGVKLRRANILSDLLSFDDAEAAEPAAEPALFDEEEFHIDMAAVAERIEADTTPREVQITYEWLLAQDTARRERAVPDSARFVATLTRSRISATADASGPSATRCSTLRARCASPSWATRSSRATSSRPTCANGSSRPTRAAARDSPRWPRR